MTDEEAAAMGLVSCRTCRGRSLPRVVEQYWKDGECRECQERTESRAGVWRFRLPWRSCLVMRTQDEERNGEQRKLRRKPEERSDPDGSA